ncbi:ABC transporter substrate-binding protein [Candidatus Albibeggiatoa sp. nov. NOAA]|uniref:ABC transporter substrate-binding protein n=1 Tax=Candidatus Albibeggiatoa sp. nov. NOAA TaxID=3162724 RepID=UPI0033022CDC|nr:ABC transporter substrate-binding protein [Thiotrichaceae bacterium]
MLSYKRCLIFLLFFLLNAAVQASPAQKIISLNLCADILLLLLSDESKTLSITYLSKDMQPYITIPQTTQFNRGLVEEVTVFQPDIVFAHTFTSSLTLQFLEQLGHTVIKLNTAQTLEDIYANINQVGDAIHRKEQARQLIQQMQADLQQLPKLNQQRVLVFYPNGFTVGQQTLADNVLSYLQLHNIADEIGIQFWGKTSLEHILKHQPELIILSRYHTNNAALATHLLKHSVLQKMPHIELDNRLWQCGNPFTVKAMQHISEAIRHLDK